MSNHTESNQQKTQLAGLEAKIAKYIEESGYGA